jgi:hypothetical protein
MRGRVAENVVAHKLKKYFKLKKNEGQHPPGSANTLE